MKKQTGVGGKSLLFTSLPILIPPSLFSSLPTSICPSQTLMGRQTDSFGGIEKKEQPLSTLFKKNHSATPTSSFLYTASTHSRLHPPQPPAPSPPSFLGY
ncbi:hypothetical protein CRENBAI_017056 [Crenichthys baileyi]|uniref:Uncharacterized protein n=1 Tax=Crenichthys baileyi TaxID=28760 RepID=A0AAV9RA57_9TELE